MRNTTTRQGPVWRAPSSPTSQPQAGPPSRSTTGATSDGSSSVHRDPSSSRLPSPDKNQPPGFFKLGPTVNPAAWALFSAASHPPQPHPATASRRTYTHTSPRASAMPRSAGAGTAPPTMNTHRLIHSQPPPPTDLPSVAEVARWSSTTGRLTSPCSRQALLSRALQTPEPPPARPGPIRPCGPDAPAAEGAR